MQVVGTDQSHQHRIAVTVRHRLAQLTRGECPATTLLESGETPGGDSVGGSMGPVIRNTSQLGAADRAAMAVYLKSLPAVEGPKPAKKR